MAGFCVLLNRATTESRKSMKSWFKVAVISVAMSRSVAMAWVLNDLYTCGVVEEVESSVPGSGKDKILRTVSHGAGMKVGGGEHESASEFHFFRFDQDGCLLVFTNGYEVEQHPVAVRTDNQRDSYGKRGWTNEVGYVSDAKGPDKYGVTDAGWRESPWGIRYDKRKEIDPAGLKESICANHDNVFSDTSREASHPGVPVNKFWNRAMGKGLLLLKDENYCCKFDLLGRMVFSGPFDLCEEGREYENMLAAATNERREEWANSHGLTLVQAEAGYAEYVKRKKGVELYRLPCGCINITHLTKDAEEEMFGGLDDESNNRLIRKRIEDIVAFGNALEIASCVYVGLSVEEIAHGYLRKGKNRQTLDKLVTKMREDHVWTKGCGKSLFVADGGWLASEPQYCRGFWFDAQGRFVGYGRFQERPKVGKDED